MCFMLVHSLEPVASTDASPKKIVAVAPPIVSRYAVPVRSAAPSRRTVTAWVVVLIETLKVCGASVVATLADGPFVRSAVLRKTSPAPM